MEELICLQESEVKAKCKKTLLQLRLMDNISTALRIKLRVEWENLPQSGGLTNQTHAQKQYAFLCFRKK